MATGNERGAIGQRAEGVNPDRRRRRAIRLAVGGGAAISLAGTAAAHTGTELAGGFMAGFSHPFSGGDHLLAMISVGLWGAFLGRPLIHALPVVFPTSGPYSLFGPILMRPCWLMTAWETHKYHQPADKLDDSWNFDGVIEDAQLAMLSTWLIAQADAMPTRKPGDEFEAARKQASAEVGRY